MSFIYAQFRQRNPRNRAANDNLAGVGEVRALQRFDQSVTVCSNGFVYKNGKRLKGELHKGLYPRVCLRQNGKDKNYLVHGLIAEAFHGPRPKGYHVDHINFDTTNNKPSNLRYLDAAENSKRRRVSGY